MLYECSAIMIIQNKLPHLDYYQYTRRKRKNLDQKESPSNMMSYNDMLTG